MKSRSKSCIFCGKEGEHRKICPVVMETEAERYKRVEKAIKAEEGSDGPIDET